MINFWNFIFRHHLQHLTKQFLFFKETGLIKNEDDEFNFVVAFYGDVKTKWVLQKDGRYKFERTET